MSSSASAIGACAQCRTGRRRGLVALVDEAITIQAINLYPYGVQLVFSDGHDRGIYPWLYQYRQMTP